MYFNPRPPWGGRRSSRQQDTHHTKISIHALRGEGDRIDPEAQRLPLIISIHALRGEGDHGIPPFSVKFTMRFQSTPSVGRATQNNTPKKARAYYFNPRPPWGGRLVIVAFKFVTVRFQSTPSVGRATFLPKDSDTPVKFQSTPSVGRATIFDLESENARLNFNPRPPWGGRQPWHLLLDKLAGFQSTPSVGGRPGRAFANACNRRISIHALRGEGDKPWHLSTDKLTRFQSTPSVGRATFYHFTHLILMLISIHALRGEGDDFTIKNTSSSKLISIHALRGEGDAQDNTPGKAKSSYFNPRPPWGGRPIDPESRRLPLKISIHALRGEGDKSGFSS